MTEPYFTRDVLPNWQPNLAHGSGRRPSTQKPRDLNEVLALEVEELQERVEVQQQMIEDLAAQVLGLSPPRHDRPAD